MKKIFSIIICSLAFAVSAQDIAEEFKKINLFYATEEPYSIQYSYQLFMTATSTVAEEEKLVTTYIKGKNNYTKMGRNTTIMTEDYNFYFDGTEKTLMLTDGQKQIGEVGSMDNQFSKIAPMIKLCSDTTIIKKGRITRIIMKTDKSKFDEIIIDYDNKNYSLKKMVLSFRKNDLMEGDVHPRVVVNYTKVARGAKLPDNIFELEDYLKVNANGELETVASYKNYKFLNYLSK